jgi:CcmD family protein
MIDNLGYLLAGFGAVWIGIFVYVRRLARRSAELHAELAELQRRLPRA